MFRMVGIDITPGRSRASYSFEASFESTWDSKWFGTIEGDASSRRLPIRCAAKRAIRSRFTGTANMDEREALVDAVAERLRSFGLNAASLDSGGGLVGVGIAHGAAPADELRFFFGTAGDRWAGEILNADGEVEAGLTTNVSASADESDAIAAGILVAIADWASSVRN